jgi:hypothetical protein
MGGCWFKDVELVRRCTGESRKKRSTLLGMEVKWEVKVGMVMVLFSISCLSSFPFIYAFPSSRLVHLTWVVQDSIRSV